MSINSRMFRSLGRVNETSAEVNFGRGLIDDAGDEAAAARADFDLGTRAATEDDETALWPPAERMPHSLVVPTTAANLRSSRIQNHDALGFDRFADADDLVADSPPMRNVSVVIEASSAAANELAPTPVYAPPVPTLVLAPGGLAIIHYSAEDADDPTIAGTQSMNRDTLSFVLLAPLAAGAVIFFTDRAWNGTSFAAAGGGEGTFTFTAGANLPAGYVVTITTAQLTAAGINLDSGGLAGTPGAGEAIFAYQGAINAPTNFIYALEIADGNNTFGATLAGTGLSVAANTATAIGADNASHAGRTWNIQIPDLLDSINDPNDWVTNDNSPQYPDETGTNLFTAPDRQIWVAGSGGGSAIQIINTDGTHSSNLLGYAIAHLYQNTSVDGNPTTQRFWHPTDVVLDTVNDKFFIVDSDGTFDRLLQGSISQALNNPGVAPTMTVLYRELPETSDGSGLTGLAIDTANQDIYFTRNQFLQRIDYNSANQTPVTLADLGTDIDTANPTYANEIGLDLARGFVYVVTTESFTDFLPPPAPNGTVGTVMYRNAIIRVSNVAPGDTNATGNTVTRVLWSGVYDETNSAATGTPQADEFEDSFGKIISVDVNTTNGDIWFTTVQLNGGANGELGGIYRASIDAGGNATVTLVFQETNATNFNFMYIEIDEETGRYYVTSQEPNEANDHSLFSGLLTDAGVAPTFVAHLGNINALSPLGLSVQSAPTLTGTGLTPGVTEANNLPSSGETTQVALYSGLTAADIDPPTGDELAGAQVRISLDFQSGAGHQDFLRISGNTSGTIAGSGITYSYNSANGVMTLSGPATVAEYAAALQMVTFSTSGDDPTAYGTALGRIVSASVFDGLLYSDELTATVTVTGINDAPVNAVGTTTATTEDLTAVQISGPGNAISVSDVDADPATQDIVTTLSIGVGTITILTNVAGGIVAGDITSGANGSATITITATQSQINATLAAANGLTYTPPANYNGATTLTVTTNDGGLNGNDPGLTGTGTSEQDSDTRTITIANVNDAPTVVDATQTAATILEDTPSTLGETVSSLFTASFSDALDQQQTGPNPTGSVANTLAGIAVVGGSTGASGSWQYLNGAIWVSIGAATTAAAVLITAGTAIRFNPALNFNGSPPDLIVHLVDSSGVAITNGATVNLTGATGGTTRYSTATVALSESVTAVNDAPVNTVGGTLIVTEDSGATNVTGMSISDVDANPATSVFTVTLDVLNGSLNVLTSVAGGVGAGNVAGNGGATVTLTGTINQINATLAAAGGVTYTPTGDYNGSDRVRITTDDGGATGLDPGLTGTATSEADIDFKTINITAVADIATDTVTITEDAGATALNGIGNISLLANDSFENPGRSITAVTQGLHGFVSINDNNTVGITSDDFVVYTAAADYNGADSFTYSVTSGGVTETATVNVTISAVADIADDSVNVNANSVNNVFNLLANDTFENSGRAITAVGAALHGTTAINNNGTPGDATDDYVTYTPTGGYNGPDSFTYTVTSGGVTETATVAVTVAPNNVAPVVDLNGAGAGIDAAAAYTENGTRTKLAPLVVLSDADNATLTGATVTIATGFVLGDLLMVGSGTSGTTPEGIGFNYNNSTGVLTLSGSASVADYQAVLARLAFKSDSDDPGTARDITVTVTDGTAASTAAHVALTITPVNDAPVNTVPSAQSGVAGSALVFSSASGNALSVADPDAGSAAIRVKLNADHGAITLAGTAGLTVTGNGTHSVIVLGSVTAINAALNGMSYQGDSGYSGADTLTITSNDRGNSGSGGQLTDSDGVAITLAAANAGLSMPVIGKDPVAFDFALPGVGPASTVDPLYLIGGLLANDLATFGSNSLKGLFEGDTSGPDLRHYAILELPFDHQAVTASDFML